MVKRAGVSLLEVTVAIGLLMLLLSCGALLLKRSSDDLAATCQERIAWETVQAKMAFMEAEGFSSSETGTVQLPLDEPGVENLSDPLCHLEVAPFRDGLLHLKVVLEWNDPRGFRRNVSLVTLSRGAP